MNIIEYVRDWYGRYERPVSSFSLFFGFIFDLLTITRLDATWTSVYILIHIFLIGIFIIIIHKHKKHRDDENDPSKPHFWYVNILQFLFGGILSTFLISYFRSGDIFVTWPFVVILITAFISNETLKRHYIRLSFQISLYFFSVYSFAIFIVPILIHRIGVWVFLLSGVLSLIYISLFIRILFRLIKDKFSDSRRSLIFLISTIFVVVNLLYFTHLIPPIPLSLKDAGAYHKIVRNSDGNYIAEYEDNGFLSYFEFYKNFKLVYGEPLYAYSAIFSPSKLNTTVIHEWQHYDEVTKKWVTENTVDLPVIGGRGGGFRTYSVRNNLAPGKWIVNVLTDTGQLIGRLRFNIIEVETTPTLSTVIK
ncbi:MAG: hypothetical protein CEO12_373 [Parcubacteria group bacterium Gr01-1014_46]|nr:MAG: hypothetical protein CEO12_373 [Parcubacteria group bacterium Gr01-1014_46]